MKDIKGIRDMWEKLLGLGKDRYVILLCIGLAFVLIASSLENRQQEKKNKKSNADKATSVYEEKNDLDAENTDLYDSLFGQSYAGLSGQSADDQPYGQTGQSSVTEVSMVNYGAYYQKQLEELLGKMEGVGKVSVFVSMKSSEELILERNNPYNRKTEEETSQDGQRMTTQIESDSQVVFYENANGKETPIIVKRYAPKVEGVVVLAQGADDPKVSAKITQFLVALFDISEHKIKVAKYHT